MDVFSFLSQYWWIIALAVGAVVAILYFRRDKLQMENVTPFTIGPNEFNHQYLRPDGGYILSRYPIPADKLPEVMERAVRGLQRTINASQAAKPGWSKYTRTSDFDQIWLVEPHVRNMDGSPALIVYGQYQTAGTVWNVWSRGGAWIGPPYIVLPDQGHPDYNWQYMPYFEESVRNESEHAREWVNDYSTFMAFVGAGDIHPHWPEVGVSVGTFIDNSQKACCAGVRPKAS